MPRLVVSGIRSIWKGCLPTAYHGDGDDQSLLRKYERELKRLRAELEERSRNLVDKRQLLYVEGERRRAEADKRAAIRALEVRWRWRTACQSGEGYGPLRLSRKRTIA